MSDKIYYRIMILNRSIDDWYTLRFSASAMGSGFVYGGYIS